MYKKITIILITLLIFILGIILISCDDFFSPFIEVFIENNNKDQHELQNQNQNQRQDNKNTIADVKINN